MWEGACSRELFRYFKAYSFCFATLNVLKNDYTHAPHTFFAIGNMFGISGDEEEKKSQPMTVFTFVY